MCLSNAVAFSMLYRFAANTIIPCFTNIYTHTKESERAGDGGGAARPVMHSITLESSSDGDVEMNE